MSASKQDWFKGSLTGWLITVMLALNCYFAKRYVDQVDTKLQDHEARISKMESSPRLMGMLLNGTNITKGN